jgi:4-amino-4-deoxy-L-arabinose transferase-like glycosyltransferase
VREQGEASLRLLATIVAAAVRSPFRVGLLAAALTLLLALTGLGERDFLGDDEILDAGLVRDVAEGGHWAFPEFNGELAPKPPLFYWLGAVSARLWGGVDEWSVRLPSAVLAAGTVFLTAVQGARIVGPGGSGIGASLLAVFPMFWDQSRMGRSDMALAFFVSAGLLAYLQDPAGLRGKRRLGVLACAALAVLAKGAAGAGLFAAVLAAEGLAGGGREALRPFLHPGILVAAAVPVAWYVAASIHWGGEFVTRHVVGENLRHLVGGGWVGDVGAGRSWLEWAKPTANLLGGTAPFGWLCLLSLAALRREPSGAERDGAVRLVRWIAAGLVLFTVAARKSPYYLLPLTPAVALLAGRWLAARTPGSPAEVSLRPSPSRLAASALAIAVVFVATLAAQAAEGAPPPLAALARALAEHPLSTAASLAVLAGLVPQIVASAVRREVVGTLGKLWLAAVAGLFLAARTEPMLLRTESLRPFAERVRAEVGADSLLFFFERPVRAVAFYARRSIPTIEPQTATPPPFWLVVREPFLERLPEAWRRTARCVVRAEGRVVTKSRMGILLLRIEGDPAGPTGSRRESDARNLAAANLASLVHPGDPPFHGGALPSEEGGDRPSQARIGDEVHARRGPNVEAAHELEFSAGPGLEAVDSLPQAVLDGGVVAHLEVEERNLLEGAPIAPVEHRALAHVEGAGDDGPVPPGEEDTEPVLPALPQELEQPLVQVRPAPPELVHRRTVEPVENREEFVGDVVGGVHGDLNPARGDLATLAADLRPAFVPEGAEEVLEGSPALADPLELIAPAQLVADGTERRDLVGKTEVDVDRREASLATELFQDLPEGPDQSRAVVVGPDEETRSSDGREGRGDQEFRVVANPGPLGGFRPGVVEDELAEAVALHVERAGRDRPRAVPEHQVAGKPARFGRDAPGLLERGEPAPFEERRCIADQGVPFLRVDFGEALEEDGLHGRSGSTLARGAVRCRTPALGVQSSGSHQPGRLP